MIPDTRPRPKRQAILIASKRASVTRQSGICTCGCGQVVSEKPRTNTHFDHRPALVNRAINAAGDDYIPPQQDPDHIDAICPTEHHRRTYGTGATTAGTDLGVMKKTRKRDKALLGLAKPKAKIRTGGFRKDISRGFNGKIRKRP